jgi:hypothetical protein
MYTLTAYLLHESAQHIAKCSSIRLRLSRCYAHLCLHIHLLQPKLVIAA